MVRSVCAELEEEGLLANTTLICGNCADSLDGRSGFCQVTDVAVGLYLDCEY